MALIEQKLAVSVENPGMMPKVFAVQGDTGRRLKCFIDDWTIPDGSTATIWLKKPSDTPVYNRCTVDTDNNAVIVELTNQMIAEYGTTLANVEISYNDEIITTFRFGIIVQRKISGGTESTAETDVYNALLEYIASKLDVENYATGLEYAESSGLLNLINYAGGQVGDAVTIKSGLGFDHCEYDETTYYLHFVNSSGEDVCDAVYIPGGGGSGGSSYIVRLTNLSGSTTLSVSSSGTTTVNVAYYEFFGSDQTDSLGTIVAEYKLSTDSDYTELTTIKNVAQGVETAIDVTDILTAGSTTNVRLTVTGGESELTKTLTFTISCVQLALTSTFTDTTAYTSAISFLYRPTGKGLSKTMYFYIDGELYDEVDIGTTSGTNLTETINLASYGHGSHTLVAYFLTDDGAQSPSLTYDIIYDAGSSTPIIASTFDTTEVTYGETITVNYVTFTHGSDYTYDVTLSIYTLNAAGERTDYSSIELESVINQTTQTWSITDYPSSGTIYLEIATDGASKTFEVYVNELSGDRDISDVTTRLIAAYTASGRSNSESKKSVMTYAYTSKDDLDTTITGTLSDFNYRSNGWVTDDNGYPVLRVSGDAEVNFDIPFFASNWTDSSGQKIQLAGTPTAAGRTFEVEFATDKVTDYSKEIITIWDDSANVGIKIFPSKAYLLSSAMSLNEDEDGNTLNKNSIPYIPFASDREDSSGEKKVRLSFVIEQQAYYVDDEGAEKQLLRIYVNAQLAKVLTYSSDSFTTSNAYPRIHAESCILDVYSMRFYDYALDDASILKNYIADKPSVSEKTAIYDANDIMDDNDDVSLTLSIKQYVCMVIFGTLSSYKGNKTKVGVRLYKPDGSYDSGYYIEWEYTDKLDGAYGNQSNVQGTSSQYYPKKNYKLTFYQLVDGAFKKVKVYIFDDRIPVNTICIKADFMSMDSGNTGNMNFWDATLQELVPPQENDSRVQTSILGYPILVFQADSESDTPTFMGRYNLNNDKSNSEAFGLENDDDDGNDTQCQKYEYLDNSEDICNWKTDKLFAERTNSDGSTYYAWEDALESAYPDQGDLEDEGLAPNLDRMQMHYSWVCQRANFYEASTESGTGGTYDGVEYDTERELKKAIFKAEFEKHFNLHHMLHYFIACEYSLMVDNFSKNFFATMYNKNGMASGTGYQIILDLDGNEITVESLRATDGTGTMDISNVDWINSTFDPIYPNKYDWDSGLGKDNNGYDQFPYYLEMWDSYNGSQVVNGASNILWIMFYEVFYDDYVSLYCNMRDTAKTLSADQFLAILIDNGTAQLPIAAVNRDERYKYIDPYLDGYLNTETNLWTYTATFIYLAQSTMESYHRDWTTKRNIMLDSKCLEDSYMADVFNFRINRGQSDPEDLAFSVAPCQALYCYTEWGNSGTYIGGKCMENNTYEMKPASSGNWYDIVLAIYGASHYRSFGDLSPLMASKVQNLSLCTNLTELILGNESEDYENSALESLSDVGYLTMLKLLNIGNCTNLTGTIDLSSCDLIEEVYAAGSGISAVSFPEGGYLKIIHLPDGITSLSIVDHTGMTEFTMDSYDSLLTLRIENTPNIPTDEILLSRGTSITRLRLDGVSWKLDDELLLEILADDSWAGKAIDATGTEVDDKTTYPTINGTATVSRIHGALLDTLNERYPNLTIKYTTEYHTVTFVSEGVTISTQTIVDGGSATAPTSPSKAYDVQYTYTFRGWDNAYTNITADTVCTAVFALKLQEYDIAYYDSDKTTQLNSVTGWSYGGDYSYTEDWPTKDGYIFTGWEDADGNTYQWMQEMPAASCQIDGEGTPQPITLYATYSVIEFPSSSKALGQLTDGERHFCEVAIQNGEADGITVTYYEDTSEYVLMNTDETVTVGIALGDTRQITLYNGETATPQVIDFLHDYSDEEDTKPIGVTYAFQNLLTDTRQMNPSYKHCFNFQIGDDEAIVSDDEDHSSATNAAALALLNHSHTVTDDEALAGYCQIKALGETYLSKIIVTHSDGTTTTWHLDNEGWYSGEDQDTFSYTSSGVETETTWFLSDTDTDEDNPFYKMGKMMMAAGKDIVNWTGTVYEKWSDNQTSWAYIIGEKIELAGYGGIIFDATGTDTVNTETGNPYNGTGESRIVYMADYANNWNNFTEMSEGAVISVPIVEGDTVQVNCYGYSRNWGGWDNTAMNKWANSLDNGDFLEQLPIGTYNTIVPAHKKFCMGNRGYAISSGIYKVWLLSNAELKGYTSYHPYMDEGSQYPIFTDNASRLKYLADGAGAVTRWWERSPSISNSYYFCYVRTDGYPSYGSWANTQIGVCFGFCSGE